MRRITGKRKVAATTLEIVKAGKHYDQGSWFSRPYFNDGDDYIQTAGQLRTVFEKNVCGTTACVAGNVVLLTLHKNDKYDWRYDRVIFGDGHEVIVDTYAREQLGLTSEEGDWLFAPERTVEEVTEALELLADGESISELLDEDDDE
jgi:hypothetical protein